jgi:predicted permease
MDWIRTLLSRVAALLDRRQQDTDLDDELGAHIELAIREHTARGFSDQEARSAALRAFGGITQTRETWRIQRGLPLLESLVRDLRFALRQLRKAPGFTFTVILTLALGIGANTAIFSVMNAVLLRMLPVRDPDQLFYISHEHTPDVGITGDSRFSSGIGFYHALRADRSAVSEVIAYIPLAFKKTSVRVGDTPEQISANEVSGNFFSALGVSMAAGQPFTPDDETKHSAVAVISYSYWTARFNRNPSAIGQSIYVRGVPFTIIGVAAPRFYGVISGGTATDLWVPLQNRPEVPAWGVSAGTGRTIYASPKWWAIMLMVRTRPGVTERQATAQLSAIYDRTSAELSGPRKPGDRPLDLELFPARGLGTSNTEYERPLHVLMSMVALVLIIACVNIIMLLIARNSSREREFAVRLALGAHRIVLFRQLLAESVLLVFGGAPLGWLFSFEATDLLVRWSGLDISLAPDLTVLAFTLSISVIAALLFGIAPVRTAAAVPVGLALKSSSGTQATASRSRAVSAKTLIAMQMAFCCVLLFASGLLLRTLLNYRNTDLGMQANSVLAVGVHPLGSPTYAQKLTFYRELLTRLRLIPGARGVTVAEMRPGSGWSDDNLLVLDGYQYPWDHMRNMLRVNWVSGDFFATLGIPVVAGRPILDSDTVDSPHVAVINQTLAQRYFGTRSPIGHIIGKDKDRATIIGIVRDSKYTSADETQMPMAWFSYQQADAIGDLEVHIRASAHPMALLPTVQRTVRELDPTIPLGKPQLLSASFEESYQTPALVARLAVFFACLAALLVAIGLYGTLAYRVSRRTVEIGVRLALGAQRAEVLWLVLGDSLILVAIGLATGLPLAWLASKWMASMLYELSAHDPFSFALAALGVLAVSIAAALIPARRAASIDPIRALRTE